MRQPNWNDPIESVKWWRTACAAAALVVCTAMNLPAQTFTTLFKFDGLDGAQPYYVGLAQGTDGNFYGTTSQGGAHKRGTLYRITPSGTLTTIYSFCSMPNCTDGYDPSTLMLGSDENLYGAAGAGGAYGGGLVFKLPPGGKPTAIYNFCAQTNCVDGSGPAGPLVEGTDGNFYGTTAGGGANNEGTVFKITPGGRLTTLHSFQVTDGALPSALILGTDGNFYGTTASGGQPAGGCVYWEYCGTVFKITPGGKLTSLYSFDFTHGAEPTGPLLEAGNGKLYGATFYGGYDSFYGCVYGCGVTFKITAAGKVNLVHTFGLQDGDHPNSPLIQATDGNLYGTAPEGGGDDCGDIYQITPTGTFNEVYAFGYVLNFEAPWASLLQATDGIFYGTTTGDAGGRGTVYSEDLGLAPFVKTVPTARRTGAHVIILGTNLTGATGVAFNGTGATFTIVSATEIATTVPQGATTGPVQVTTPGGTLTSNVPFRVLP